jgi:RNA polymerase sigma factor (sigma-70 family)
MPVRQPTPRDAARRHKHPERFGAWLAGIGLNICRRQRLELLSRPSSLDVAARDRSADRLTLVSPDPGEVAIERQVARAVRSAIGELPRGQREAVALFYLSGLTYRETALALGIEVGAVKARLHKARAHLGEELRSIWKEEEMERTVEGAWVEVRASDVLRLAPSEEKETEFVVMLEEIDGKRRLPIWIREPEATWLAHGIEQVELPRPGPYSMLASLLDATGTSVREVRIERLVEATYYAVVIAEGKTRAEIDARPSDALNLAVLTGAPIFVASDLFKAAAMARGRYEDLETQLREEATVGAATIGSEARAAWQRTLEELTGEDR